MKSSGDGCRWWLQSNFACTLMPLNIYLKIVAMELLMLCIFYRNKKIGCLKIRNKNTIRTLLNGHPCHWHPCKWEKVKGVCWNLHWMSVDWMQKRTTSEWAEGSRSLLAHDCMWFQEPKGAPPRSSAGEEWKTHFHAFLSIPSKSEGFLGPQLLLCLL